MAASGSLMPNPKWYFVDNNGEPLGAGFLYTYRSLDKVQKKFVYQDAGLTLPYADPIRIDANGTFGPIFWANDEPYYVVVRDHLGVLIWDMDNFWPTISGGGGGGGSITTILDVENLIPNNVFYRNDVNATGSSNSVSPVPQTLIIAPGGHAGLSGNTTLATTTGSPSPDIVFNKATATLGDTLTIGTFILGNTLGGPDPVSSASEITPVNFLNYAADATAVGFRYVQFPITGSVQNLNDTVVFGAIWVQWNSGTTNLTVAWRQFFGDGPSASAEVLTTFPIVLTATAGVWLRYTFQLNIPTVSGKNLGECGNDGLFFQVRFQTDGTPLNISFTKPTAYTGLDAAPTNIKDFLTNDQIEAWTNGYRTGDVRTSLNAFAPHGWVPMNDGTIGSATSAATTRANRDSYPLYALLWNGVTDAFAPVSTGRGASASADFAANKTITLTRQLGRVLGEAGTGTGLTARTLGEFLGEEKHTMAVAELAAHNHASISGQFVADLTPGPLSLGLGGTDTARHATTANTGSSVPFNIMQPTTFYNMFIKL